MRRWRVLEIILFFSLFFIMPVYSEEDRWDIDSIFDQDDGYNTGDSDSPEEHPSLQLRPRGFTLEASFDAYGGIVPGWSEAPWFWADEEEEYSTVVGMTMAGSLGLDFKISDFLRVKNTFYYTIPDSTFSIQEFFLDYHIKNRIFFRAGKYIQTWGISANYQFTNLLARLPPGNSGGDSYLIKANIPIGIGGLELLALTRDNFINNKLNPSIHEIGFGGKYNWALQLADIDFAVFYHEAMPLRSIVSIKTTIGNTELYAEGMGAVNHGSWDNLKFSANLGIVQDLFGQHLTMNGEIFYNGENDTSWFVPETVLQKADVSPFISGFNGALNVIVRPLPGWKNFRIFNQLLYAFRENTAYIVPGFSISPLEHVTLYFSVPMAAGSRNGTYYYKNSDTQNRPFTIVFLVNLSGTYTFSP